MSKITQNSCRPEQNTTERNRLQTRLDEAQMRLSAARREFVKSA